MFIIQGPFPVNNNLIVLPSPQEANTENLRASVQTVYKMSGKIHTYVKPRDSRKSYRWEFIVGQLKAKEVEDYFISNAGKLMRVDWGGNTYIGYPIFNPFEMSGEVSEFYRLRIELEEQ